MNTPETYFMKSNGSHINHGSDMYVKIEFTDDVIVDTFLFEIDTDGNKRTEESVITEDYAQDWADMYRCRTVSILTEDEMFLEML